jgi:hypothetical protein
MNLTSKPRKFMEACFDTLVVLMQTHWGVGLALTLISAFSFFVFFPSFLPNLESYPFVTQPILIISSSLLWTIKWIGIIVTSLFSMITLTSFLNRCF